MTLQTERLDSVEQIGDFLDGNGEVDFRPLDREEAYGFVRRTLVRLDYDAQGRAGKGTVREFLGKATGLSRAQVTRLIGQYRATGRIEDRRGAHSGRPFARVYTAADIRLLAEADEIGGQLCGPAACAVLRREYEMFGDARVERRSRLSPSHLYNLRRSQTYRTRRTTFRHTRPTAVRIGERRRRSPTASPASGQPVPVMSGASRAAARATETADPRRSRPGATRSRSPYPPAETGGEIKRNRWAADIRQSLQLPAGQTQWWCDHHTQHRWPVTRSVTRRKTGQSGTPCSVSS